MEKKNTGIIISCSIFGAIGLIAAFFAIMTAFSASLAVDLEYFINTKWNWTGFNLLLWSLIVLAICVLVIIGILVISDDKVNKQARRERKNSFK